MKNMNIYHNNPKYRGSGADRHLQIVLTQIRCQKAQLLVRVYTFCHFAMHTTIFQTHQEVVGWTTCISNFRTLMVRRHRGSYMSGHLI